MDPRTGTAGRAEDERSEVERLRALDEMKNDFLSMVSHELRTPLTAILGLAVTLEGDAEGLPETTRMIVRRIAANARRLEELLADLLDVDRLSRGVVAVRPRPTDMAALAAGVLAELDMGGRPVQVDIEPGAAVALVDQRQVERIVENLLANAARHTPEGTSVWVRVGRESDRVLLVVEDDGPGVPAAMRDAIFQPFRRGAAKSARGVGIGLTLVARFASLHGGRAWVEDRPGGGASFRVLLPAWTHQAASDRVLVVDWEGASTWQVEGRLLETGHEVLTCGGLGHRYAPRVCPLVDMGRCTLAEGAGVVVFKLPDPSDTALSVLHAYRTRCPGTLVIVEAPPERVEEYRHRFAGCVVAAAPVSQEQALELKQSALSRPQVHAKPAGATTP